MKPVFALLCIGAFAAFSFNVKRQVIGAREASSLTALPVGKPMPDFTLADRNGKLVTLSAVAPTQKLTLINFWGAWCAPCRVEMPSFQKAYADTANRGLLILAIDEDDPRELLDGYLKQHPLTFPILIDSNGTLANRLGIHAYPTSVLVDQHGNVMQVIEGLQPYFATSLTTTYMTHSGSAAKVRSVELEKKAVKPK